MAENKIGTGTTGQKAKIDATAALKKAAGQKAKATVQPKTLTV